MKIIQYFIGEDEKYIELTKQCQKVNKEYAQLNNYKFEFDRLSKDEIFKYYDKCSWDELCGYKIKYLKDKLEQSEDDYLVFIDADAAVSNPTIKIEEMIDDKHEIFLSRGNQKWLQVYLASRLQRLLNELISKDYLKKYYYDQSIMKQNDMFDFGDRLSYGNLMFNEGFIVVKNTQKMKQFFNDCWNNQKILRQIPYSKMPLDGRSISFTLLYQKYNDLYAFMYEQAQGGYANSFDTKYDEERTFLMHNFGKAMNMDQKIQAVKWLSENKWWKNTKI